MARIETTTITCDKDLTTTIILNSQSDPLLDGWLRVSGYCVISNGKSESIDAYFCPDCVAANVIKDLTKTAIDNSNINDELKNSSN